MMTEAELKTWCHANWMTIPAEQREKVLAHLRGWIKPGDSRAARAHRGFHLLGGGMQIRNRIRDVMMDDELPGVMYDGHSKPMKNWDDYYTGALDDLEAEENGNAPPK